MNDYAQIKNQGEITPETLITGEFPRIARVVIITGGNYPCGAVLGKITASGKYKLAASAASDGSKVPDAILAENADASASDVQAVVYFTGEFNSDALTFGTGLTIANVEADCRSKSIFIKTNQGA